MGCSGYKRDFLYSGRPLCGAPCDSVRQGDSESLTAPGMDPGRMSTLRGSLRLRPAGWLRIADGTGDGARAAPPARGAGCHFLVRVAVRPSFGGAEKPIFLEKDEGILDSGGSEAAESSYRLRHCAILRVPGLGRLWRGPETHVSSVGIATPSISTVIYGVLGLLQHRPKPGSLRIAQCLGE